MQRFAKVTWGILIYNLAVILWGAFVRATGSGAGCGAHWPLCNGEVIPREPQIETLIELTHRLSSGLALLLVVGLLIAAWRIFPPRHPVRLGVAFSMFFMITEALVGAALVLFEWVGMDASAGRVISISVHLVNTLLLLASLTLTAWWASGGAPIDLQQPWLLIGAFGIGYLGMLLLGISGAITALGDTLFPAESLAAGIQQDFSPTAHFLIRLRVWHPVIAILTGAYVVMMAFLVLSERPHPVSRRFAQALAIFILTQLGAGLINLILLAPVWMQLVHLLLADMVWISLVLYSASVMRSSGSS